MRNSYRIRNNGVSTEAVVVGFKSLPRRVVNLQLEYKAGPKMELFKGKATATYGQYNIGDKLPIFYLPENPSKMTVDNKTGYYPLLIFTILIFLFIVFATFKIEEMV